LATVNNVAMNTGMQVSLLYVFEFDPLGICPEVG
jgi:hypothetical protein